MRQENDCPLTPALLELLQASATKGSMNSKVLARVLNRTARTIDTEFQRICELLEVHARPEALMVAVERGWVVFPSPPHTETEVE